MIGVIPVNRNVIVIKYSLHNFGGAENESIYVGGDGGFIAESHMHRVLENQRRIWVNRSMHNTIFVRCSIWLKIYSEIAPGK